MLGFIEGPPIPTYAWASKPSSAPTGTVIFISDAGTKGSHWYYDGSRWKPVGGVANIAARDTALTGVTNSEAIAFQALMPAGLWQTADRLRLFATVTRSGVTDALSYRLRIGTAGTTADATITGTNANLLTGGSVVQVAFCIDVRLESATSAQLLGVNSTSGAVGYSGAGVANALAAATAISSAAANALYVSLTLQSAGATNTGSCIDAQLQLVATPN